MDCPVCDEELEEHDDGYWYCPSCGYEEDRS